MLKDTIEKTVCNTNSQSWMKNIFQAEYIQAIVLLLALLLISALILIVIKLYYSD